MTSWTLYHGSDEPDIVEFDVTFAGPHGYFGSGVYTTPDDERAAFYGRYVYELQFNGSVFEGIEPVPERGRTGDRDDVWSFTFQLGDTRYVSWDPRDEEEEHEQAFVQTLMDRFGASFIAELADERAPKLFDIEYALENIAIDDPEWAAEHGDTLQLITQVMQAYKPLDLSRTIQVSHEEIGTEVAAAGYDAVLIPGLEVNYGDEEFLVFDPSKLTIVRIMDTRTRNAMGGSMSKPMAIPVTQLAESFSNPIDERKVHRYVARLVRGDAPPPIHVYRRVFDESDEGRVAFLDGHEGVPGEPIYYVTDGYHRALEAANSADASKDRYFTNALTAIVSKLSREAQR